jgi:hypothetical protein
MKLWIAAVGTRPRDAFEDLARLYLDRIAPLLPGSAKTALEAPVFRSEDSSGKPSSTSAPAPPPCSSSSTSAASK